MTVQTNIPPNVPDALKVLIYQELDADLNGSIFDSLLQGIYTGIVTLWNICKGSVVYYFTQTESNDIVVTSKSRHIGRVMIVIIILLHGVTMVNFAVEWSEIHFRYVNRGQSFWTEYLETSDPGTMMTLGEGIMAAICTILADSTIIWRCWIVWGQRWLIILPPVLLLISATVLKMLATYELYVASDDYIRYFTPYSSCVLATTLWCTLLIIYRIVTVARAGSRAGGGLRAYRHVLEVLVESSALYSISLILCTAFFARNTDSIIYFDALAGIARGIAPTLIVGRVAAGHARSADSWQGSMISGSLRFRSHVGGQSSPSDLDDLEAQRGGGDEYVQIALTDNQKDTGDDEVRTLTGTQEDIIIDLEGFVREDHTEIDAGKPADGHFLE
ncbi:hypothetical protein EDD18DRAFT_1420172 [Armillaria luteobubalina]|uniref:Uncharacterized protein n=1 Tax=Armillaria luteobubalina TaxID=153913 RepID=A0AA39PR53_9AGAR|nr:hypothetical protein EDD18DRAFT_1420172 [Armillaria luteobubalina]